MKLNQILSGIFCLLCSVQAWAVHKTPGEHWFEIEVILFSQIGDKSNLKENFDDIATLPAYSRYIDLLAPHFQPNTQLLKQHLPYCDSPNYPQNVDYITLNETQLTEKFEPSVKLPLKVLPELQKEVAQNHLDSAIREVPHPPTVNGELENVVVDQHDDFYANLTVASANASNHLKNENTTTSDINTQPLELNAEQLTLLAEAEQAFSPKHLKKITLLSPRQLAEKKCVWTPQYYAKLKAENPALPDYNGIEINEVSGVIDGAEFKYSNAPYLIAKESLQLSDINKKLSLSKNFKPLLHFGWRQHTLNKNKALPLKVFAGDNLQADHEKALQQYRTEQSLALAQEESLASIMTLPNTDNLTETPTTLVDEKNQAITLRLQEIFAQIDHAPKDLQSLIELTAPPLLASEDELMPEPEPPAQPWYLEGFIKVHVYHYLHVTADFNIMNKTLTEQKRINATQALANSAAKSPNNALQKKDDNAFKPIHFKQDRRVLSGDVHYFDHPYMGMILQIRRYTKPEKPHTHDDESEHTH